MAAFDSGLDLIGNEGKVACQPLVADVHAQAILEPCIAQNRAVAELFSGWVLNGYDVSIAQPAPRLHQAEILER